MSFLKTLVFFNPELMANSHLRSNLTQLGNVGDGAMTSLALWRHAAVQRPRATEQVSWVESRWRHKCDLAISYYSYPVPPRIGGWVLTFLDGLVERYHISGLRVLDARDLESSSLLRQLFVGHLFTCVCLVVNVDAGHSLPITRFFISLVRRSAPLYSYQT